MKRGGKIEIWLVIGLLFITDAKAVSIVSELPYDGIAGRNVFNLHPPSPKQATSPEPLTRPPTITFTGITTILGRRLAFLTIGASKPGALPLLMILAEGQVQEGIEVMLIDEKAGVAKVVNHGEVQILDFDHDGVNPTNPQPASVPKNVNSSLQVPLMRSDVLSPEEQIALIEIQRVKYQQENNPIGKILPPTEVSSEMGW